MSEVLRWANIALEEDHEYMMNMCFSFLSYIGMSTPVELKSCLPEILDLMLKSEQCSQFYCKYFNCFFLATSYHILSVLTTKEVMSAAGYLKKTSFPHLLVLRD